MGYREVAKAAGAVIEPIMKMEVITPKKTWEIS
jgi:hypothetical protein